MKERDPVPFGPDRYAAATSDFARNRLLFDWLCDDKQRRAFYDAHRGDGLVEVPSRVELEVDAKVQAGVNPRPAPAPRKTWLVLDPQLIADALHDRGERFSNLPYARIGSGGFMLALDPHATARPDGSNFHGQQKDGLTAVFGEALAKADTLADVAIRQARPVVLRAGPFDAAVFAQQAAVRYCSLLFGYALKDFVLLEKASAMAHAALAHTILARHFVSDPLVLPQAIAAMGALAQRTGELLDAYALHPGCEHPEAGIGAFGTEGFQPVMQRLAKSPKLGSLTGEHLTAMVVGSVAGTVGNIQAATCIALEALLPQYDKAHTPPPWLGADAKALEAACWKSWHANPPVPFLARRVVAESKALGAGWGRVGPGDELILAIGAATSVSTAACDPMIFGSGFTHDCLGRALALPLIQRLVEEVRGLPSVARRIDPLDDKPMPLKKTWAFQCTALPLTHRVDRRVVQQPLNVAMRVKAPVAENATKLREVIRGAAPRIEEALDQSRHVHFAWFEFNDMDHTLVLHTVFDGDFDAYVDHFALAVGDLFDLLFKYIEPAPPLPVSEHPAAFVEMIRRFNRPPAGGYFYSAYPLQSTAACKRNASSKP